MEIDAAVRHSLHFVLDGVTELAGFQVASVSVVSEGMLETVAVAGEESAAAALMDLRTPVAALMAELEGAEEWGPLRFLPHQRAHHHVDSHAQVPDVDPVAGPDAWHPLDLLCGLLRDASGTLRGVLAMDLPRDGRIPGAEQRRILQLCARHAEIAVVSSLEQGDFAQRIERQQTISDYRGRLIDVLSHELQGTASAIANTVDLISLHGTPDSAVSAGLPAIHRGVQRIRAVVDDMHLLAKLVPTEAAANQIQVDLARIVRDACGFLAADAALHQIEVTPVLPSALSTTGNPQGLDRMVVNVLSNAIKYSDSGGHVTVRLREQTSRGGLPRAILEVEDDGIGIPEADLPQLFEEFFRSDNPETRRRQGTGLGLPITERVVARHGGKIFVDSTLGQGTTVTVELPIILAQEPAEPPADAARPGAPRHAADPVGTVQDQ